MFCSRKALASREYKNVNLNYENYNPLSFVKNIGKLIAENQYSNKVRSHPRLMALTSTGFTPMSEYTFQRARDVVRTNDITYQLVGGILNNLQPNNSKPFFSNVVQGAFVGCEKVSSCAKKAKVKTCHKNKNGKRRCKKRNRVRSCRIQSRILKMFNKQSMPKSWLENVSKFINYNISIVVLGGNYEESLINGETIGFIGSPHPFNSSTKIVNIAHIFHETT